MIELRKARPSDVPAMLALINDYATRGLMLPRTEFEMCENLRDFTVAVEVDERGGDGAGGDGLQAPTLLGCGALHFYTPQTAELRSLAVSERRKSGGVGRRLVQALVEEARGYGLDIVFAFTYVVGFFEKCGFVVMDRGSLPLKAWKDCIRCPKFSCCDETAMVYLLSPEAQAHTVREPAGDLVHLTPLSPAWTASPEEPIALPTPARGFQQR